MRIYVVVITTIKLSTYICNNAPKRTHAHTRLSTNICATHLHNKVPLCVFKNLHFFTIQKLMLLLPHLLLLMLLLLL